MTRIHKISMKREELDKYNEYVEKKEKFDAWLGIQDTYTTEQKLYDLEMKRVQTERGIEKADLLIALKERQIKEENIIEKGFDANGVPLYIGESIKPIEHLKMDILDQKNQKDNSEYILKSIKKQQESIQKDAKS